MTAPMPPMPNAPPGGPPGQPGAPLGAPGAAPTPPLGPQPDPRALKLLAMLPVDELQDVAKIRMEEFGRAMSGAKFQTFPPEWQLALFAAFEDARHASGTPTVAEQMQAAAQAQQAQAAQHQQQLDAMQHDRAAQRAHQSGENAADRAQASDQSDRNAGLARARLEEQAAARQDSQPTMSPPPGPTAG